MNLICSGESDLHAKETNKYENYVEIYLSHLYTFKSRVYFLIPEKDKNSFRRNILNSLNHIFGELLVKDMIHI